MAGLGTIINSASIIAGGVAGHFTGRLFCQKQQDSLNKACGVSVLFIAIAGAMEGMLEIENNAVGSGKYMFVVLCLTLGTVVGKIMEIETGFEKFGGWLKEKTGNSGDAEFVNAFISFPIDTEFFTASPQPISLGTSTILTKYSRPGVSHNHLDFFFACHGGISRLRHGQRAMRRPVIDGYAGIPFGHKAVDEAGGKGIPAASLPQLYHPAP